MRPVRVATASILISKEASYPSQCIQYCMEAIDYAGSQKADLVVLPEEPDVIGCLPEKIKELPGPIPGGATFNRFCQRAKENNIYVVYSQRELCDGKAYNTGVLIDRQGQLVGKYRKMHLAPSEEKEVCFGDLGYPVFQCDFGKVGIGICMDIHFPEMWRIYALDGADILLFTTQCMDYTGDHIESIVNARAIDNQVYLVSSHFVSHPYLAGRSMGHSRIVDPYGRTLADTSHKPAVAIADLDLDCGFETWYEGELKQQYPTLKEAYLGLRRPDTYQRLVQPDGDNPAWKIKRNE